MGYKSAREYCWCAISGVLSLGGSEQLRKLVRVKLGCLAPWIIRSLSIVYPDRTRLHLNLCQVSTRPPKPGCERST
ncbi:hypothetical protein RRG08_031060 [Elysia crispata]|uniref:Uncharacterized protein n=1 Tax=Elysia crispata TaxID=231223 RepID=A0AAE0ZH42_9GAST|nr:hypothetical protein RRG08_031060 [Elysia crispata]